MCKFKNIKNIQQQKHYEQSLIKETWHSTNYLQVPSNKCNCKTMNHNKWLEQHCGG